MDTGGATEGSKGQQRDTDEPEPQSSEGETDRPTDRPTSERAAASRAHVETQ